jgi:hypothetical protein
MTSRDLDADEGIPPDLLDAPSGGFPEPPVETAEQVLPFGRLSPENFERLCLRLARLDGTPVRCRRYGVPGQKQYGIDIYSRVPSGRYVTYQCKRYETINAADLVAAVDAFLDGKWFTRSERFVFCSAASLDRTELEETIEQQADRLAKRGSVEFEVWDAESLSTRLRQHEDIVALFFGPVWRRRFFGTPDVATTSPTDLREIVARAVAEGRAPKVVSHDWAPAMLRSKLDDLRRSDPDRYSRLADHVDGPPVPALVHASIENPPEWLTADDDMWALMARVAQAVGEWTGAARAWEHLARSLEGSAAATAYARGAIAASEARDIGLETRLLEAARNADPTNATLLLATWDDERPRDEQLVVLGQLQTDDPEEQGLIAAQTAVVQLLAQDLEGARESLCKTRELLPGSLLADGLEVSVVVQAGRLAAMEHRAPDRAQLAAADALAEQAREKMHSERRFSQATRMLMLRADILATLGEREAASKLLRTALPEERQTQEQKEVLANAAAGRAIDHRLALEFLEDADETPFVLKTRLACLEDVGTPAERQDAIRGLDRIVAEGGRYASEAAFERLAACLGQTPAPWSDASAVLLRSTGHERAAVSAEAQYLLRNKGWSAVEELLRPYGRTPWALASALRASLHSSVDRAESLKAGKAVLAIGPGPSLRVEAAQGLARGGDHAGARDVLMAVARDANAPDATRADAYDLLMKPLVRDLDDWSTAATIHREWVLLRPGDARAHPWAPMVATRGGAPSRK